MITCKLRRVVTQIRRLLGVGDVNTARHSYDSVARPRARRYYLGMEVVTYSESEASPAEDDFPWPSQGHPDSCSRKHDTHFTNQEMITVSLLQGAIRLSTQNAYEKAPSCEKHVFTAVTAGGGGGE